MKSNCMAAGGKKLVQAHPKIRATILAAMLFLCAGRAGAVCTQHGTVTASSTAIVGLNDISGVEGRHYFLIQNSGANPMYVAIGTSNAATSSDMYLSAGSSWVMQMQGLKMVPGGDVAAIAPSGNTTYGFCDW